MAQEQAKAVERIPITVVVARVEHPGFYCLGGIEYTDETGKLQKTLRGRQGVFFPVGSTDIEVTPEELAALKAEEAKTVPVIDQETGEKRGTRPAMPIKIIEYSPAEQALRLAAKAEKEAREADDAAQKALEEAERKAQAAKRLRGEAGAATERAEAARARR